MDVHKEATTIAVMNAAGKLVMESIVETKAATIVQFLEGLRGELYVTFEEGTRAAEALRDEGGGVQPTQERSAKGGQQE